MSVGIQSAGSDRVVHGTVAKGYEGVRAVFEQVVADDYNEPGAQLAAYADGRQVVDLWAGDDIAGDTLHAVFSNTKGAAHVVVAMLVEDGVLDLDRRVAEYWPEFAAHGKARLTLRQLLQHRSGVIGVDGGFSTAELADDRVVAARLADQKPFWEPGESYGYHAYVIGALTGEVVRRVTGSSIQELFEERIRAPFGLDFYIGLPEEQEARYVPVRPMDPPPQLAAQLAANPIPPDSALGIAFNLNATPPTDLAAFINERSVRALGPTSAGGIGNARGLARFYAAVIGGLDGAPALLSPDTIAEFSRLGTPGVDAVTGDVDHFGLGFETVALRYPFLGAAAFGHSGAAGSQAFADPTSGIAYGYTRRRFHFPPGGGATENDALAAAVVRAAKAESA
ncbi:serine hydrolase domain-containing protein [Yinghuangia seranimata]|uniref:serine hydrolase domain-containing protein n=1 Tax=Yinghuangia seranimata TaxID=408067 RepID=UPI00248C2EA9|nr:serine hydrolase domain-containing protein [Yinghuangia seranimata]MDI2125559.1 serine hydrolase domain-containing protein [Yinghuangia seranimata]